MQKLLLQALAVLAVVGFTGVGGTPPESAMHDALADEFGRNDSSSAGRIGLAAAHFVYDAEPVAAAQIVQKIDLAGKDVCELHRDRVGQPDRIGRSKKGSTNFAGTQLEAN